MTLGDFIVTTALVIMGFGAGVLYEQNLTKMIVPVEKVDPYSEFDEMHGVPNPKWLSSTMKVRKDLGNGWLIIEETTKPKQCFIIHRKAAHSGGTGMAGYMAMTEIFIEKCMK